MLSGVSSCKVKDFNVTSRHVHLQHLGKMILLGKCRWGILFFCQKTFLVCRLKRSQKIKSLFKLTHKLERINKFIAF